MFACGGGNICYNNLMNKIVNVLKKYMYVVAIFIVVSIILGVSYSNFIVTSNNHKAAEMYIGALKYSIEIDGNSTNTLTIPTGETIIDVKVNNQNTVDTYYKLLYLNNSNLKVKYFESAYDLDDSNNTTKSYDKSNDSVASSNSKTIKLQITNNSTSSQTLGLSVKGGYITNTLSDITVPSTYSEITSFATNTYFCKTTNSLTQGTEYVNGQYTYVYKQEGKYASTGIAWNNIYNNGWGTQLTDKTSTNSVTSKLCTYINNKPITSMSYMFYKSQATKLDLSSFDTTNVTNMYSMFSSSQATSLDLSSFDTSKVTTMASMFYNSQATTINLSNLDTSNVTNMNSMFSDSKATTLDLSSFDTSNITSMSSMFSRSQATSINLDSFDTSRVTNMSSMFSGSQATSINLDSFDTSKVTNMSSMFSGSQAKTVKGLEKFNTSNVTSMKYMFYESQAATLDVSNFDTSKVTDMSSMFSGSQATTLDLNFNTENVTNMSSMFQNSEATTINGLNKFNTSKVTDMSFMFNGSNAVTLDLSSFDTSKVTTMFYMFRSSKATTINGLKNFNTKNVTNMSSMFCDTKVTTLDLSSFNTSNVTSMAAMFDSTQLEILDLSSFDTSKLTLFSYMFYNSKKLKTIYVSDKFVIDKIDHNIETNQNLFVGCDNLVGGAGTKKIGSKIEYARIDGGTSNPGYFTDIADKDIPAPNSFATDSWKTIIKAVKNNNISKYNVGDTKKITLDGYGTHTLRIANTSTPSECSTEGFSQTACGFVIEFADIITTHNMNDTDTNVGGWPASNLYTFVNVDIYNSLSSDLKSGIIDTTVVSGKDNTSSNNYVTNDKLYLLTTAEISKDAHNYDIARFATRQLDYYKSIGITKSSYSGAIKKNGSSANAWWLRSAINYITIGFLAVDTTGFWNASTGEKVLGVSPAFRIG